MWETSFSSNYAGSANKLADDYEEIAGYSYLIPKQQHNTHQNNNKGIT